MTKTWLTLAVVPVAVLALGACSTDGPGTTTLSGTVQPAGDPSSSPTSSAPSAKITSAPARTTKAPVGQAISSPGPDQGLDFGYVTEVLKRSGEMTITINRATFISDPTAPDDYRITDTSKKLRTFTLSPDADLRLLAIPGGGPALKHLSMAEFVNQANNDQPALWLRHTDGLSGTVTAVSEQYLP